MTHTARVTVIASRWKDIFEESIKDNEDFGIPTDEGILTVKDIFYGDQMKIPRFPAICIEPGQKSRLWPPQPSLRTENTLEVHIFVYWAQLTGSEELKLKTDQLGEDLEEFMNSSVHLPLKDSSGSPLVIHGHVVENEPSYAARNNNTLVHASRLLWRAITKTQLTVAG